MTGITLCVLAIVLLWEQISFWSSYSYKKRLEVSDPREGPQSSGELGIFHSLIQTLLSGEPASQRNPLILFVLNPNAVIPGYKRKGKNNNE